MTPPALASLKPGDRLKCIAWWKRSGESTGRVVAVHADGAIELDDGGAQHRYVGADAVVEVLREDSR